jgi:hypothetical protein
MYFDFAGDLSRPNGVGWSSKACSMGPVGIDSAGRKIGITAGHCNQIWDQNEPVPYRKDENGNVLEMGVVRHPGAPRGVEILNNQHPIYDLNAAMWAKQNPGVPAPEPIGWVRWVDADTCDWVDGIAADKQEKDINDDPCVEDEARRETDRDSITDYMVIEFAPDVQLSSQVVDTAGNPVASTAGNGKLFKVTSTYTDAAGPALPGLFAAIETFGSASARRPDPTAPNWGLKTSELDGLFRAGATHRPGDSGGPAVIRGTGKWVGIAYKTEGVIPPWIYTSAKNILADLNPRGIVGSGFTPINN